MNEYEYILKGLQGQKPWVKPLNIMLNTLGLLVIMPIALIGIAIVLLWELYVRNS